MSGGAELRPKRLRANRDNVIPAQAGIQRVAPISVLALLDLRVSGDDGNLFPFREVWGVE